MKRIILLAAILSIVLGINVRRENGAIGAPEGKPDKLYRINLKKSESTSTEKRQILEFVKLRQSYLYGDKESDDIIRDNLADGVVDDEFNSGQLKSAPLGEANYIQSGYKSENQDQNKMRERSGLKKIDLYNFKNTQYTGELAIGDPTNLFQVIYDTGSANMWINSAQCNDPGCQNHKRYDHSQSKNFRKVGLELDVQFGTGELQGEINEDTVYFGGIEINKQGFSEIISEDGDVFAQSKFDGIVGLAFPQMAAFDNAPIFDNIIKQNRLEKNEFGFFMENSDGKSNSQLILGGVDENLFTGDLTYHKVIDQYYWMIQGDNILVGGKDIGLCPASGCRLIADSGTSLLTGPTDDLFTLLEKLNVDEKCGNVQDLPDLTFVIDGINYQLLPEEYVMTVNDEGIEENYSHMSLNERMNGNCAAAFMPLDIPDPQGPAWILGDIFLQKFYSTYDRDNSRVGFALARHSRAL